jgi:hypothetical protein
MKRYFLIALTILGLDTDPGWPAEKAQLDLDCPGKGCPAAHPERSHKDREKKKDEMKGEKPERSQIDPNRKIEKPFDKNLSKELQKPAQQQF